MNCTPLGNFLEKSPQMTFNQEKLSDILIVFHQKVFRCFIWLTVYGIFSLVMSEGRIALLTFLVSATGGWFVLLSLELTKGRDMETHGSSI